MFSLFGGVKARVMDLYDPALMGYEPVTMPVAKNDVDGLADLVRVFSAVLTRNADTVFVKDASGNLSVWEFRNGWWRSALRGIRARSAAH